MSNIPNANSLLTQDDPLSDFEMREISLCAITKKVYVSGSGPAVIVMHELPGISPHVARFARWVRDAGFTVYMPSLFGRDGAVPQAEEGGKIFQRVCVSREFRVLAGGGTSPVVSWLRALAKTAYEECGGLGVGTVGMCFTGNFAVSLMIEPSVRASVACQPSLPLDNPAAIEMADEDAHAHAHAIAKRLEKENLTILAYRFEGDQYCMASRFDTYKEKFGERFDGRILPDSAANKDVSPFFAQHIKSPHSVVTQHLVDKTGEPTLQARDEVISFLHQRLETAF